MTEAFFLPLAEPYLRQLTQANQVPVPIVKALQNAASEQGLKLDQVIDINLLRQAALLFLHNVVQHAEANPQYLAGKTYGDFCRPIEGQINGLQRILGEHDDFVAIRNRAQKAAEHLPLSNRTRLW
jgi:hypothetical protein